MSMLPLWIYLGCTALVALRLGWHMRYRLDWFDWQYGDVWPSFWMWLLLWPLLLLKPRVFIDFLRDPTLSGTVAGIDVPARERELHRLHVDLPPCSALIRYQRRREDRTEAWIVLLAETVEHALVDPRPGTQHHDILRWVRQRDLANDDVTDVPEAWWEFSEIAADLLEDGKGVAHCARCGASTPASDLKHHATSIIGHSFRIWNCPCGQEVLAVPGMHIHTR